MVPQSVAPTVNVYTTKHAGEEGQCAEPKNWKEWGSFAVCRSWEWIDAERIISIWTVILGIATCILGIATWKLWRSTDRLVLGAEETAQHQLRAYVTARGMNLVSRCRGGRLSATGAIIDGPVHTYELSAIIRNGGQTPAVNMRINVSCKEQHIPLADDFDFPDSDTIGYGLIGPDSEIFSPAILVSAQQLETETAGRTWFFWGWVEYDDIFPSSLRHRTEFCFRINRRRLEWTNEFVMQFAPDARFNGMDRGCMRKASKDG